MASSRILATCAAFALVASAEGHAHATVSAINLTPTLVTRVDAAGNTYECRGRGPNVTGCIVDGTFQGIGQNDCMADSRLNFPINITGLPDTTGQLQVWAGTTDCTQAGATGNNTTATCWMVAPPPGNPAPVMDIQIRVADIAGYLGKTNPNLPQSYMPAMTSTACDNSSATTTQTVTDDAGNTSTTVGEATVNIYFMWFLTGTVGQAPAVSTTAYPVKVKLLGPAACTGVTAGTGDGILNLTWTPPAGDTTIQGFDLFAVPTGTTSAGDATTEAATTLVCNDASQPGTQLLDDAGNPIFDDAGNPIFVDDAGNPLPLVDAGCYSQIVPPSQATCGGSIDTSSLVLACTGDGGTASTGVCDQVQGPTNASGTITGLSDSVSYDVAVAAFDQYGNVGQISSTVCGTPLPINDFWKQYNQDGGNAFCALEMIGRGGSRVAAALLALVGIVMVKRRRRG